MKGISRLLNKKCKRFKHHIRNILQNDIANKYITPPLPPPRFRMFIYSILGHKLKGNVFPDCFLGVSKGRLFLGQGSFINYSCFLDLSDDIVIGKNVAVGFKTTFINATHEMGSSEQRAGNGTSQPIRIEDGCWIGAGVTIMPV